MAHRTENAATLAVLLASRHKNGAIAPLVTDIQAIARRCHRNAERMCNGELRECPACHGNGWDCAKCRETGYPALALESQKLDAMRELLKPYRLRVYEQGDPRGWPLYLIPEEIGPASEDSGYYNQRGVAVCPH